MTATMADQFSARLLAAVEQQIQEEGARLQAEFKERFDQRCREIIAAKGIELSRSVSVESKGSELVLTLREAKSA